MGCITLFYYLSYFIYMQKHCLGKSSVSKPYLKLFVNPALMSFIGFFTGALIYFALHHEFFSLGILHKIVSSKTDMVSPVNNYILAYFTDYNWYYHFPEFTLFATTVYIYFKNKLYRDNPLLFILLVVLLISTFITRRNQELLYLSCASSSDAIFLHLFCHW